MNRWLWWAREAALWAFKFFLWLSFVGIVVQVHEASREVSRAIFVYHAIDLQTTIDIAPMLAAATALWGAWQVLVWRPKSFRK